MRCLLALLRLAYVLAVLAGALILAEKVLAHPHGPEDPLTCLDQEATMARWADTMARRDGLDPAVFRALIEVESGWDPWAVSPAGAEGLTQIVPDPWHPTMAGRTFEPCANLSYGSSYLGWLVEAYQDYHRGLCAYHDGRPAASCPYSRKVLAIAWSGPRG